MGRTTATRPKPAKAKPDPATNGRDPGPSAAGADGPSVRELATAEVRAHVARYLDAKAHAAAADERRGAIVRRMLPPRGTGVLSEEQQTELRPWELWADLAQHAADNAAADLGRAIVAFSGHAHRLEQFYHLLYEYPACCGLIEGGRIFLVTPPDDNASDSTSPGLTVAALADVANLAGDR